MAIFGGMMKKPMFGQIPGLDMMQEAVKPPMQMNNVPMGAPQMVQKKPGFFSKGGGWIDALGAFGDAFSENGPVYAQQKAQRNRLMQEQQMAEQKRQQDRENFLFEESYKRANPMPTQPTEFERILRSSGLPESQQIQLMQDYARNRANPIQGVPYTDEEGNGGIKFIRPSAMGGQGGAVAPTSQAEYEALPAGAQYRAPDGSIRTKGGGGGNVTGGFR